MGDWAPHAATAAAKGLRTLAAAAAVTLLTLTTGVTSAVMAASIDGPGCCAAQIGGDVARCVTIDIGSGEEVDDSAYGTVVTIKDLIKGGSTDGRSDGPEMPGERPAAPTPEFIKEYWRRRQTQLEIVPVTPDKPVDAPQPPPVAPPLPDAPKKPERGQA